jgi:hypothetical protein
MVKFGQKSISHHNNIKGRSILHFIHIMKTLILNKLWKVSDLQLWSSTEEVKGLIYDYLNEPYCTPYEWVIGKQISDISKASFIHSLLN